jgi:hypothetical protein
MSPDLAVLAEARSDADTIVVIIRRLLGNPRLPVLSKGFSGCGELRRKGASHIRQFSARGASRFVICHDADGPDPEPARRQVQQCIVAPAGLASASCIIIPVQELEAWIIADEAAIRRVIPTFDLSPVSQPETQGSPKEWLVEQSRRGRTRPLYVPAVHNPRVAEHVDFHTLGSKCVSFRPLPEFLGASVQ